MKREWVDELDKGLVSRRGQGDGGCDVSKN